MSKHRDVLPGGLADKKQPKDFNRNQIRKGVSVELEHTNDKAVATEIAMDHLEEDGDYYQKLEKMEKKASFAAFFDELVKIASKNQKLLTSADRAEFKRLHPERAIVPGKGSPSGNGCSLGKDEKGYFVYTHRARSKSRPTVSDIPKKDVEFVGSTS